MRSFAAFINRFITAQDFCKYLISSAIKIGSLTGHRESFPRNKNKMLTTKHFTTNKQYLERIPLFLFVCTHFLISQKATNQLVNITRTVTFKYVIMNYDAWHGYYMYNMNKMVCMHIIFVFLTLPFERSNAISEWYFHNNNKHK